MCTCLHAYYTESIMYTHTYILNILISILYILKFMCSISLTISQEERIDRFQRFRKFEYRILISTRLGHI